LKVVVIVGHSPLQRISKLLIQFRVGEDRMEPQAESEDRQ